MAKLKDRLVDPAGWTDLVMTPLGGLGFRLAGDVARNLVGEYSLVATDILSMLPLAFERVHERASPKLLLLSE